MADIEEGEFILQKEEVDGVLIDLMNACSGQELNKALHIHDELKMVKDACGCK